MDVYNLLKAFRRNTLQFSPSSKNYWIVSNVIFFKKGSLYPVDKKRGEWPQLRFFHERNEQIFKISIDYMIYCNTAFLNLILLHFILRTEFRVEWNHSPTIHANFSRFLPCKIFTYTYPAMTTESMWLDNIIFTSRHLI